MDQGFGINLVKSHPESAATLLEELSPNEAAAQVTEWPPAVAGRVLERMLPDHAGQVLLAIEAQGRAALLRDMQPRAALRVLHQLEDEVRQQVLADLDPEHDAELRALAAWPEDSAGGIMDTQVAVLRERMTVAQAIETIRRTPPQSLHYLYVADGDNRLVGVLVMRDMLLAAPTTLLSAIMRSGLVTLPVACPRDTIVDIFDANGYAVLPVVDDEGHILGVVRHDAVIEVAREEGYEDMAVMVGAGANERALDPAYMVVRRRLPWLLVNLGTAFLASVVVGAFEPVIASVTALAVLLPVVAGQSGNTGAQSMAIVMRGIVTEEIRPGLRARVIRKELVGGLLNGFIIAIVAGLAVWLWDGRIALAGVIAVSMILAMGIATVAGAAVPLAISAMGRDPAQSSSIILTTITDVLGFMAFLGLAALAMSWL